MSVLTMEKAYKFRIYPNKTQENLKKKPLVVSVLSITTFWIRE